MKPVHARIGSALALVLVTACVPQPRSAPPVVTQPVPAPAPTPASAPVVANWMDAPQTPGDWRYRNEGGESFAEFSGGNGAMLFQINCTADRDLTLSVSRRGTTAESIRILTEAVSRTLDADTSESWVNARLVRTDRLLDAMALSKGRFAVAVAGAPTLYLPSWAEVTRVIEDCR